MAKYLVYKSSMGSDPAAYRIVDSGALPGFTNAGFVTLSSNIPDSVASGVPSQSIVQQYGSNTSTNTQTSTQTTGQVTPFSGTTVNNKVYYDQSSGRYYYYNNGWYTLSSADASYLQNQGAQFGYISGGEANWIQQRTSGAYQNPQNNQNSWTWNITSSSYDTTSGAFSTKPTLTINGQSYTFNTPQEYIQALQNAGIPSSEVSKLTNIFSSQISTIDKYNSQNAQNNANDQKYQENLAIIKSELSKQGITFDGKVSTVQAMERALGLGSQVDDSSLQAMINRIKQGDVTNILAGVGGVTSPGQSTLLSQINFKEGLTQIQKQGIVDLVNSGRTFNETDAHNYAYAIGDSNWQQYVGKNGTSLGLQASQATSTFNSDNPVIKALPASITSDPTFQSLTADQQALIGLAYGAQTASTDELKQNLTNALQEALKVADPYTKEQIRIVQDQLSRGISSIQEDTQTEIERRQQRIQQINEDLTFNKDQLSLEQQSELAQELRDQKQQLETLQQNMSESGLAFSSPRKSQESDLLATQQGVRESTARKYARLNREQDVTAARNIQELQQGISDIETNSKRNLTTAVRNAESEIGTVNLPTLPSGVSGLGDITGRIPEERQRTLADLEALISNNYLDSYLK